MHTTPGDNKQKNIKFLDWKLHRTFKICRLISGGTLNNALHISYIQDSRIAKQKTKTPARRTVLYRCKIVRSTAFRSNGTRAVVSIIWRPFCHAAQRRAAIRAVGCFFWAQASIIATAGTHKNAAPHHSMPKYVKARCAFLHCFSLNVNKIVTRGPWDWASGLAYYYANIWNASESRLSRAVSAYIVNGTYILL